MWSLRDLWPVTVSVSVALVGCGHQSHQPAGDTAVAADTAAAVADLTDEARHWADSVAAAMTLDQLAAQCLMPGVYADTSAYALRSLDRYARMGVGGVVLLRGTTAEASGVCRRLADSLGIAPFTAVDAEWGLAMRFRDATAYPAPSRLEAEDVDMYQYGRDIAAECRRIGINMVLGPVADLSGGGMMRSRCYSSDPDTVAEMATAYVAGLQSGGVMAVAKHFPGHGHAQSDSHRRLAVVSRDSATVAGDDLQPFVHAIGHGLQAVMAGHIAVPSLDPSGRPASVSPWMLDTLLRKRLGFGGLILTDAINMGGAKGWRASDALRAGADIVLVPPDVAAARRDITSALGDSASVALLRDRVRRILFYKYLMLK